MNTDNQDNNISLQVEVKNETDISEATHPNPIIDSHRNCKCKSWSMSCSFKLWHLVLSAALLILITYLIIRKMNP